MIQIGIEIFAKYMRMENKYFESKNYQTHTPPNKEVAKKYKEAAKDWEDFRFWNKNLAEEIETGF